MTLPSSFTRRRFLHHSAIGTGAVAAFSALPRPLMAMLGGPHPEPVPAIQDDRIKALVQRGLDAAKAAGATYADIRMTHTRNWGFGAGVASPSEEAWLHVGVRALVDGYWGFATSPVWSPDELVRLGRSATQEAKANTIWKPREMVLPPMGPPRAGHWETPVEMDPFAYHPDEIVDYLRALVEQLRRTVMNLQPYSSGSEGATVLPGYTVTQQSKAFGATDGSYCTQRLLRSDGGVTVYGTFPMTASLAGSMSMNSGQFHGKVALTPTAVGWELFRKVPFDELIVQDIRRNQELDRLPNKPVEVNKYATVLDAQSVANLLSRTIGAATQLDRALGYEANASGTSYLTDPLAMLGNYSVGAPLLTVTANRTEAGGTATVKWDDEGTEPTPFTLVNRGVVSDFAASREAAGWLKLATDRVQRPFQSNGCMHAETGGRVPSIFTPNLVMQPAQTTASQEDLEAGIEKGMVIENLVPIMDFQMMNGYSPAYDRIYEIANGKRVARIYGAGVLFRTTELWKAITAMGGAASQRRFGLPEKKGSPEATGHHSVTAVPVALKEFTFIDQTKR